MPESYVEELTFAEHLAAAQRFLNGALKTPQEPGTDVVCALVGIGHALLALVEQGRGTA